MTVTGKALEMKLALHRLHRKHGIAPDIFMVPLTAPTAHPTVLTGYASTTDIDLTRMKFRAYAFGYPLLFKHGLPPLHLKHDESKTVGTIDALSYDDRGQLLIRATVTHEQARRAGAFSVGARVLDYELRDIDTPDFHALVTSAEVCEVSLTDCPANMNARVTARHCVSPVVQSHSLMIEKVKRLIQMTALMKEVRP